MRGSVETERGAAYLPALLGDRGGTASSEACGKHVWEMAALSYVLQGAVQGQKPVKPRRRISSQTLAKNNLWILGMRRANEPS